MSFDLNILEEFNRSHLKHAIADLLIVNASQLNITVSYVDKRRLGGSSNNINMHSGVKVFVSIKLESEQTALATYSMLQMPGFRAKLRRKLVEEGIATHVEQLTSLEVRLRTNSRHTASPPVVSPTKTPTRLNTSDASLQRGVAGAESDGGDSSTSAGFIVLGFVLVLVLVGFVAVQRMKILRWFDERFGRHEPNKCEGGGGDLGNAFVKGPLDPALEEKQKQAAAAAAVIVLKEKDASRDLSGGDGDTADKEGPVALCDLAEHLTKGQQQAERLEAQEKAVLQTACGMVEDESVTTVDRKCVHFSNLQSSNSGLPDSACDVLRTAPVEGMGSGACPPGPPATSALLQFLMNEINEKKKKEETSNSTIGLRTGDWVYARLSEDGLGTASSYQVYRVEECLHCEEYELSCYDVSCVDETLYSMTGDIDQKHRDNLTLLGKGGGLFGGRMEQLGAGSSFRFHSYTCSCVACRLQRSL
jgi:hypothetical protein